MTVGEETRLPAAAPAPDLWTARTVTRSKARTFALACGLLPVPVRDDVYRLYLIFRTLDDLVDESEPDAASRVDAVRAWALGRRGPVTAEVAAFTELAGRHALPRQPIVDFCAGMDQDLNWQPLRSERDVDRYCYRVAGTVGIVMSSLLGAAGSDAEACAIALGIAMQRTNILRDIDDDAAAGRIYISDETVRAHGDSLSPGRRRELIAEQVARADDLYEEGIAGIRCLSHGQLAIRIAAALYREILREVSHREVAGLEGRAVVSSRRKLVVATRALLWDNDRLSR